jgi:hypothetical protein
MRQPEKASNGGLGREFDYRAIVERHFGKHTGLRHSAKACPGGHVDAGSRPQGWQAKSGPIKPREGLNSQGAKARAISADPGESHASCG